MDMDQSAVFLAATILTALGFTVIVSTIVLINNILHAYWKPVSLFKWAQMPAPRFMTDEEASRISPTLDDKK